MRDFNHWIERFRQSINGYNYYVDFPKVYSNVDSIKVELNIMNSLISSKNIESDFRTLLERYPEILKCIPILLAVRSNEIYAQDAKGAFNYSFNTQSCCTSEQYLYFMKQTGLLDLLENHLLNNLVDYVLGVETGLDSNGRKNRGGHQMEDLVEKYIQKSGAEYYKEMYLSDVENKWSVNLSKISAEGTTTKRWDFVVKTDSVIYLVETNFYASGGSKLNETARSYKMIAEEAKQIHGVEFIWITDGGGWYSARRNLEETFNSMEHLYNINDLDCGVLQSLFSK